MKYTVPFLAESGNWPAEDDDGEWGHGDIKDVAYLYTWQVFDKMVQDGGLQ